MPLIQKSSAQPADSSGVCTQEEESLTPISPVPGISHPIQVHVGFEASRSSTVGARIHKGASVAVIDSPPSQPENSTDRYQPVEMRFIRRLQQVRRTRELTIGELARRSGISPQRLQAVEAEQEEITLELLYALASGLEVSVGLLLRGV